MRVKHKVRRSQEKGQGDQKSGSKVNLEVVGGGIVRQIRVVTRVDEHVSPTLE